MVKSQGLVSHETDEAEIIGQTGRDLATLGPATMDVVQWCADNASVGDDDTAAAMEDIVRQVLMADNPDEVFAENLTVDVDSILGITIQINGIRIGETDFAEGFPYYALIDCVYGTPPAAHVVTCGGFKVMAQLKRLSDLGEWPQVCKFKQSDKPTKSGKRPLSLVRAV